ncbi:MAG: MaoC family dehydratase [Desulfarculales bacterium]|jgi:acyl dehydratase|nr:MaoC family dehydratase [Desulfarculales bacterium]
MSVSKTYAELKIGDRACVTRTITPEMVNKFAEVSGDYNPVHLDAEYAKTTRFGRPIAHGMLCIGLLSALFGTQLPGEAIYIKHLITFKKPVFVGETVTAWVEIVRKTDDRKRIFEARAWVENQAGEVLVDGEATLMTAA